MTPDGFLFELSGGALCLDFVNTRESPRALVGTELLARHEDLVSWGEQAGAISAQEARALRKSAAAHPGAAQTELERSLKVRALMASIFSARAAGRPLSAAEIARLNPEIASALARLRLSRTSAARAHWSWSEELTLDRVLWPVLRSAAELLTSEDLGRLRECAAEDCAWMFLDRSRNGSRRWCDMSVCGNRNKVRRHRSRRRKP